MFVSLTWKDTRSLHYPPFRAASPSVEQNVPKKASKLEAIRLPSLEGRILNLSLNYSKVDFESDSSFWAFLRLLRKRLQDKNDRHQDILLWSPLMIRESLECTFCLSSLLICLAFLIRHVFRECLPSVSLWYSWFFRFLSEKLQPSSLPRLFGIICS